MRYDYFVMKSDNKMRFIYLKWYKFMIDFLGNRKNLSLNLYNLELLWGTLYDWLDKKKLNEAKDRDGKCKISIVFQNELSLF